MISYFSMESVRDLIIGKYDVKSTIENPVPIPSWNRYPCDNIKICERRNNKKCKGFVSIYVNTKTVRWILLEICFFREKQRAYIRVDCLQMQKLFELGIININDASLTKETF
ncbi:MAG: hypothetical protein FWD24_04775 [Treponema sp.]|nr:hypothetical protein [Treponema sp.]